MPLITRFAPSPTGLLHIGNVRTALICYLFAKKNQGQFMLRLDDTDIERSTTEFAEKIQQDLKWMGLNWDVFARQSDRMERYNEIIEKLKKDGRIYACYETTEEIEIKRKMQLSRGKPPIYDRAALQLTQDQIERYKAEGRQPHWRFKLDEKATISWNDMIKGTTSFKAEHLSDPVLIRANGAPTYMLPSAIDDMDFNITHVVRGEDHVTNTAIQIQLFEAMGATIPAFAHMALIKGKEGKISKRLGGFEIEQLRDQEHIEAMTIASMFARLGSSEPVEPRRNLSELVQHFDLSRFSKTPTQYDFDDLEKLNSKILHLYEYDDVKDRPEMAGITKDFWYSVRPNLTHLKDVQDWHAICHTPLESKLTSDDLEFTSKAATCLPTENWDNTTWDKWIEAIKQHTTRKGKELFMPLRKAITGQDHGPELKHILPLIGQEKVLARLHGKKA